MTFVQEKIDRSVLQARGIFNKYVYQTDDTMADVQVPGYFSASRFAALDGPSTNGDGWHDGVVECQCSDGYLVGIMDASAGTLAKIPFARQGDAPGVNAVSFGADPTGTVDVTTLLISLLTTYGNVYLPPGRYKVNPSTGFKPPKRCRLHGVRPEFIMNGSGGGTFTGGSVIIGLLDVGGGESLAVEDLGVDNPTGNAVQSVGPSMNGILLRNLVTNAGNHNYLFEQYNSDNMGATGGGIWIDNPEMHGGPNGVAIKCKNVWVTNAIAHDITVQAYVAVSDNIQSAAIYNRAQNVTFLNCVLGQRCTQYGGRVYSRDAFSTTNANNVQPAKNIRFISGDYSLAGRHGIMIGDEVAQEATQTRILSESILIDTKFSDNGWNGLRVASGKGVRVTGSTGGNGTAGTVGGTLYTNFNVTADQAGVLQQGGLAVQDFAIGSDLVVTGTAVGMETGVVTILATASTFSVSGGAEIYKTANTVSTFITAVTGGSVGQEFTIWLADNFSVVGGASLGGTEFRGLGQWIKYRIVDSAGTVQLVGPVETSAPNEVPRTYAASFNGNYSAGLKAISVAMTGDMTAIGIFPPASTAPRDGYSLRLIAGASTRALSGWTSAFKFPTAQFPSGAPSSVAANTTLLITFFWDGAFMVAKGSFVY